MKTIGIISKIMMWLGAVSFGVPIIRTTMDAYVYVMDMSDVMLQILGIIMFNSGMVLQDKVVHLKEFIRKLHEEEEQTHVEVKKTTLLLVLIWIKKMGIDK